MDLYVAASHRESRVGYAWLLVAGGRELDRGSGSLEGTPHRGELMAAIEGLTRAPRAAAIRVHTKNDTLRQTGAEWIAAWRANRWKRKGGIKHLDLVKRLAEQLERGEVIWLRANGRRVEELREEARAATLSAAAPAPLPEPRQPSLPLAAPPAPESAPHLRMPTLIAYTDGGCRGNPGGIGGWGVLLVHVATGAALERRGGEPNTTNNRMELQAVIEAARALVRPTRVEIRTDSTYVRNVCSRWMQGWKAAGWQKRDKQPIKNLDQIRQLDELLAEHTVTWKWVRGHAGEPGNEYVDALATDAMDDIQKGGHGAHAARHAASPIPISAEPQYPAPTKTKER